MSPGQILVIAGPTAVGKTHLSLKLAEKFGAEILSADSRQIYKYLDIGTAKPTPPTLKSINHHLIDFLDPAQTYSAARFAEDARSIMDDLECRGKKYIIVGGSGLYIKALAEGLSKTPAADPQVRDHLNSVLKSGGKDSLYKMLKKIDPLTAERLKPNDTVRIIRAIEVHKLSGITMSAWQKKERIKDKRKYRVIVINRPRDILYSNIERRVDDMIKAGLFRETKDILASGYSQDLNALKTVGYKESIEFINGKIDETTAISLIKQNTRHYAKRQLTWFRGMQQVEWLDVDDSDEADIFKKLTQYYLV